MKIQPLPLIVGMAPEQIAALSRFSITGLHELLRRIQFNFPSFRIHYFKNQCSLRMNLKWWRQMNIVSKFFKSGLYACLFYYYSPVTELTWVSIFHCFFCKDRKVGYITDQPLVNFPFDFKFSFCSIIRQKIYVIREMWA